MNEENEILYNEIYERTKDFGRTHFIREIMRLQQENNQLKATNESLTSLVNSCQQEIRKHKEVIEEIREYINHEWFKRGQLGIIDKSFQEWQLKDILQILDKVKEVK